MYVLHAVWAEEHKKCKAHLNLNQFTLNQEYKTSLTLSSYMIILILGDRDAFLFKFSELEISSSRWDIFSCETSFALAGGLESQGFLIFPHDRAWHRDAGMVQDEENHLRWFKT